MGGRLFGLIENAMVGSLLLIALAFFTRRTEWVPMLVNVLGTPDRARNMGAGNTSSYSNPALDSLVERAAGTFDDAAREEMLREATRLAMADGAIIPLYHQTNSWVLRRGLAYQPRLDERTLAKEVRQGTP